MGKVVIKNSGMSENGMTEVSIRSLLRSLKISKISGMYHLTFGSTEVDISADLMKGLIEDAFMMLDYDDQIDLLKLFSEVVR